MKTPKKPGRCSTAPLLEYFKKPLKFKIFLIFLLALCLRFYGLNWDQSQHLHPDERFLTMVASDIKFPSSISQYFSTPTSPLNPENYPNYQFFVYGTFPLFLTKITSSWFHQDTYSFVQLWGRGLSAIFDAFNIFLLYFLAKKIIKNKFVLLPSLLYAFTVLPLQLSHFFAVDTFLTTFLLATFTLMVYQQPLAAAITFGLALSSKITAVYFAPVILIFFIYYYYRQLRRFFIFGFVFALISLTTFRIFQPYAFTGLLHINPQFIANFKTLAAFDDKNAWYPPGVQWLSKIPLLFPIQNIIFWGAGLPLTAIFFFNRHKIKLNFVLAISFFWILFLLVVQGVQDVTTMRYFLPIYPFICLWSGFLLSNYSKKIIVILVVCHLSFGILFLSIYSRPNSRVQATDWINQHIPASAVISSEYWDDALPLGYSNYQSITLPLYDPDTTEKWSKINGSLSQIDYLIMSSNRLWGSIPLVPNRYPVTSKFYQNLFASNLQFKKLIEINSYPGLALSFLHQCYYFGPTNYPGVNNNWFTVDSSCNYPGIYLRDDTAEEAFTVYDHPKVLIFQQQ